MKRVKAACICQTLHFMLKEDIPHEWAVKQVEQEIELYIKTPVETGYLRSEMPILRCLY